MSFLEQFQSGNLVLPSALLFHFKDLFHNTDEFLVWQFFYAQNTTAMGELAPSQIADSTGKTVAEINRMIASLTDQGLLDVKIIELSGEIEMIVDASPALAKLDHLLEVPATPQQQVPDFSEDLKGLVSDFERELGRLLSPFELESLQKTLRDDKTSSELVRAALREAVFNGKTNWNYIHAILRNWRKEGVTTIRQIEERRKEREQLQSANVTVSDAFLNAMNLWSD